jgi:hypothetical protein
LFFADIDANRRAHGELAKSAGRCLTPSSSGSPPPRQCQQLDAFINGCSNTNLLWLSIGFGKRFADISRLPAAGFRHRSQHPLLISMPMIGESHRL